MIGAGDGSNVVLGDNGVVAGPFVTSADTGVDAPTAGGNDTITTGSGDDVVVGGLGADTIIAGDGNNLVGGDRVAITRGQSIQSIPDTPGGDDVITTGSGTDAIIGGAGSDWISAGDGVNVIIGDNGHYLFAPGQPRQALGNDVAAGGDTGGGNDAIHAGNGVNLIIGGVGSDAITGGDGLNVVFGDNAELDLSADGVLEFAQSVNGPAGDGDMIATGAGRDLIVGGAGGDVINAGAGDNAVAGDDVRMWFAAGVLRRMLSVDTGADAPAAGAADQINTGDGNDVIIGGLGADSIDAGGGDNVVVGDNADVLFAADGTVQQVTSLAGGGARRHASGLIRVGWLGRIAVHNRARAHRRHARRGRRHSPAPHATAAPVRQFVPPASPSGDRITTGNGNDVVIGGDGGDTISSRGGNDVILGDNGTVQMADGVVLSVRSGNDAQGAADSITARDGADIVIGGAGGDFISLGQGPDVVIGDRGSVDLRPDGTLLRAQTLDVTRGGGDTITARGGGDVVLGGAGSDRIDLGTGRSDVAVGDGARVDFDANGKPTRVTLVGGKRNGRKIAVGTADVIVNGRDGDRIGPGSTKRST